jgi:hypothetical protein
MAQHPLSQVPPDEFTKARAALVKELRERGENDEAKRVASLRRPSTALWVTNQLGARAPKDLDALIDSSRRAQRAQLNRGSSDELRAAMHDQREALHRLMAEAQKVAAEIGAIVTPELQRRIQDSVQSAATEAPEALREGTLERELSAAGFGALLSGPSAAVAKVRAQKAAFEDRKEQQKRLLAEKRERLHRQREAQRGLQAARKLAIRAEQLEKIAREAQLAADRAKEKAKEARRAADEGAARLAQIREELT